MSLQPDPSFASPGPSYPAALSPVCPVCDQSNTPDARYCSGCGAPVHLRECPHCEAINDREATACYKCAAVLVPATAAAPPLASGWPAPSPAGAEPDLRDDDVHFIGPLTAPVDEAELPEPDTEPVAARRLRGAALLGAGLALMVIPALVAINVLERNDPGRVARAIDDWGGANVAAWFGRSPAASEASAGRPPQPARVLADGDAPRILDERASRAPDRNDGARTQPDRTTRHEPVAQVARAPDTSLDTAQPRPSTSRSAVETRNAPIRSPSVASLAWTHVASARPDRSAMRQTASAQPAPQRSATDVPTSTRTLPAAQEQWPRRATILAGEAPDASPRQACTPALAALALCGAPRIEPH